MAATTEWDEWNDNTMAFVGMSLKDTVLNELIIFTTVNRAENLIAMLDIFTLS